MKKWITYVFTLSMVLCLLTGCGGDVKTAEQTDAQTASEEKAISDGYWVVEKMEMEDAEFSGEDMTGMFGPADSIMSLAFDTEGTFDAVLFEDFLKGTYNETADALELDFAGESVKGTCTEDTLVLNMKDGTFTLKRQDKMPEMLANNPWVSYMPEFDAQQTAAMSNFMSYGYYLIEDEVIYGLTHSQSTNGSLGATPFHMKGDFPEVEETVILDEGGAATHLCKENDTLYYILNFEKVCRIKTDGTGAEVLYEGPCDYLQIHEGRLYFTDKDYHFVSTDMNGGDLQNVVNKEIYYPYFICSDWMVFQDDADNESLHLYNTTHGTELNITHVPSHNPILDGHYLYYTDMAEERYFLCQVDMSNPDKFLFDASELSLRESSFMIDDQSFYTTNSISVAKEDWKKLTDEKDATEEIEMYVSKDYKIYHYFDSNGIITGKYVMSKEAGGGKPFQ